MEQQLHQAGEIIGDRYQVITPLGQGGSATTYASNDLWQGQRVAIKVLSLRQLSDWKTLDLFEREVKTLKNLNHPQIPKYLDYFTIDTEEDRRFYLVQELAEGESLDQAMRYGWRPTEAELQVIARQMLDILSYLHSLNPPVIHRDIKPQNIIRTPDNRIYLVDFGAVQDLYKYTFAKTFVGTLGYMPPEQFRGEACPASDLYALGATLLFLLTHRDPADLPQKRLKIDFRDRIATSKHFKDWLEKMLEPAVEDRFQSAQQALQALEGKTALLTRTKYTSRAPKGSRVQIQRTADKMTIRIPSEKRFRDIAMNIAMGIGINLPIVLLMPFLLFLMYFLLLPLLLGIFIYILTMVAITRLEYRLEFTERFFQIHESLFGIDLKTKAGLIADIVKVEKEEFWTGNRRISQCVLWEGVKKHTFARHLTEIEQDWIVQSICDYIGHPAMG